MKKNSLLLIALLPVFSFTILLAQPPLYQFENGLLQVDISNGHSKETLMALKKQLLEDHSIQLDFEELAYNKKGEIERIKIAVKTQDGFSGTASSRRFLGVESMVWFVVDYNEGAAMPFGVGAGKR